ncbi:MAG TPA: DHHA1 domain-containing protein [Bryobacteraceae bacterium]
MTERLYYNDCYLRDFSANIVALGKDGLVAYLDRTAFYPSSGGQPFDIGSLAGAKVIDVIDEDDRVAHKLDRPIAAAGSVEGRIDWSRRFDHMQQHTGQHLLSAVFEELYAMKTLSFHMGAEVSTIELGTAQLDPAQIIAAERRANELIGENREVHITFEDAQAVEGLRKISERSGTLRIVSIDSLDRSACGGTHVRRTGEIGSILIRKLDKVRGNVRIEFVCGLRSVTRSRAEYDALTAVARAFSCANDEAPRIAVTNAERVQDLEKSRRKMAGELAAFEGQALWTSTVPDADGMRRATRRGPITEDTRALANGFTAGGKAMLLQVCDDPPSFLLAASKDSGLNAGALVKEVLAEAGGRGGGSPVSAQGSVPSRESLAQLEARITSKWLS